MDARDLGVPIADEQPTWDGLHRMRRYQSGAVFTLNGRSIALSGPLWKRFERLQDTRARPTPPATGHISFDQPVDRIVPVPMGYPLADTQRIEEGDAVFFERGAWYEGPASDGALFEVDLWAAPIGRPSIVPAAAGTLAIFLRYTGGEGRMALTASLYGGRLFLEPVLAPGLERPAVPLLLFPVDDAGASEASEAFTAFDRIHRRRVESARYLRAWLPAGTSLAERTLYDLLLVTPDGLRHRIAPHCLYARTGWASFGVIHATDIHVNHRSDRLFSLLADRPTSRAEYQNFNEAVRRLVRFANHEHASGGVDLVCATGDLVDYGFDKGENHNTGGNFALFRDLLLGASPSPDPAEPAVEELRVPIFTVPGNHDYRPNPYELAFVATTLGVPLYVKDQFEGHNLTLADAERVQGFERVVVTHSAAFAMLAIDKPNEPYHALLCDLGSYVVPLGRHRLVMLDSKWDTGRIISLGAAIRSAIGWLTDAERSLLGGSPPLEGIDSDEVRLLQRALAEAGPDGLVLLGLHAPLFNMEGDEYAHYFRETQPAGSDHSDEIIGYLMRHPEGEVAPFEVPRLGPPLWKWDVARGKEFFAGWFSRGPDARCFCEGNINVRLNYGSARGEAERLLALCAGAGGARPVDLVLFGHGHNNVELRVEPRTDGGFRFFHDYYTTNPAEYYPSVMLDAGFKLEPHVEQNAPYAAEVAASRRNVRVMVRARPGGAAGNAAPRLVEQETGASWAIDVDPYPDPLNAAADKKAWWARHRPLLLQTGGLGPLEHSQRVPEHVRFPTFSGVRVVRVQDNEIAAVDYVRRDELAAQPTGFGPTASASRAAALVASQASPYTDG